MPDLMSLVPPAGEVYGTLKAHVIPAAGAAALALALFLCLGRWAGALGSGVAALAGIAFVNWQSKTPLVPWAPEKPGREWLPFAAAVLVAVGLLSRWGGLITRHYTKSSKRWWWTANAAVWVPRVVAVAVVSGWGLPELLSKDEPNAKWVIAAGTLLAWVLLDGIARENCSCEVVAALALPFFCSGWVLFLAFNPSGLFLGTVVGVSLFGVAVVGAAAKAEVSGAIPVALGFLPGFLAGGRSITDSPVPVEAFWLVAVAPLGVLPFLVPALARRNGWLTRLIRLILIAAPLAIAFYLATRAAPPNFDLL